MEIVDKWGEEEVDSRFAALSVMLSLPPIVHSYPIEKKRILLRQAVLKGDVDPFDNPPVSPTSTDQPTMDPAVINAFERSEYHEGSRDAPLPAWVATPETPRTSRQNTIEDRLRIKHQDLHMLQASLLSVPRAQRKDMQQAVAVCDAQVRQLQAQLILTRSVQQSAADVDLPSWGTPAPTGPLSTSGAAHASPGDRGEQPVQQSTHTEEVDLPSWGATPRIAPPSTSVAQASTALPLSELLGSSSYSLGQATVSSPALPLGFEQNRSQIGGRPKTTQCTLPGWRPNTLDSLPKLPQSDLGSTEEASNGHSPHSPPSPAQRYKEEKEGRTLVFPLSFPPNPQRS